MENASLLRKRRVASLSFLFQTFEQTLRQHAIDPRKGSIDCSVPFNRTLSKISLTFVVFFEFVMQKYDFYQHSSFSLLFLSFNFLFLFLSPFLAHRFFVLLSLFRFEIRDSHSLSFVYLLFTGCSNLFYIYSFSFSLIRYFPISFSLCLFRAPFTHVRRGESTRTATSASPPRTDRIILQNFPSERTKIRDFSSRRGYSSRPSIAFVANEFYIYNVSNWLIQNFTTPR